MENVKFITSKVRIRIIPICPRVNKIATLVSPAAKAYFPRTTSPLEPSNRKYAVNGMRGIAKADGQGIRSELKLDKKGCDAKSMIMTNIAFLLIINFFASK